MDADAAFYERAMRRIYRFMLPAGGLGFLIAVWLAGWQGGAGFLVGTAAGWLNFSWLHQVVDALAPGARPRRRLFVFVALRYPILGVSAYVIVKIFGMNGIAALGGLFVPVAAIIFEAIYELAHG